MSKLDIKGMGNISSHNNNTSSMIATEEGGRIITSQATKTFDGGVRNQTSIGINREHKFEPIRRKLNNNNTTSSNSTTTRRMGDDLRRTGMQVADLSTRVKDDEKVAN